MDAATLSDVGRGEGAGSAGSSAGEAPEARRDPRKRRQILDGARAVFLAQGFDAASMGEIAKRAGVSKGTLYVYFDSKEDLFEALTLAERSDLAEAVFQLDEAEDDPPAVLRRLGASLLEALVRPDHISALRMVIGASDRFPRFGQAFYEAGPCVGRDRLAAYLDREVAAGQLAIDDTSLAAQQFLDLCMGSTLRRLLLAAGPAPDGPGIAAVVEAGVLMFMARYGRPPTGR